MMHKTTDMFVEHSQHDAWHMPLNSLAFATDIVGICHRHHWHLPQTSLATHGFFSPKIITANIIQAFSSILTYGLCMLRKR